jgi:hypothetical protein
MLVPPMGTGDFADPKVTTASADAIVRVGGALATALTFTTDSAISEGESVVTLSVV